MNFLKIFSIFAICLLFFAHATFAQIRHCGTEAYGKFLEQQDPSLKQKRIDANLEMRKKMASYRIASSDANKIYRIPVVVHVIWNSAESNISDEMIYSQIKILNDDYRRLNADTINTFDIFKPVAGDAGFEFFLAGIDPEGNASNGIVRKYTSATAFSTGEVDQNLKPLSNWPSDQYLNLWVTTINQGYLGIGPYPSDVYDDISEYDATTDGIVINYKAFGKNSFQYNLGRTATHEIGHWLGLIHIWGNSDDNCGNDEVSDTPLQENSNQYLKSSCPAATSNCSGSYTQDMADNYMDYSPDQCMNIFTKGQAERMHYVMENNHLRQALQKSPALTSIAGALVSLPKKLLHIYPNPSNGTISFQENGFNNNTVEVTFFDKLGKDVLSFHEVSANMYDISALSNGMYLIRVISGQEVYQTSFTLIK